MVEQSAFLQAATSSNIHFGIPSELQSTKHGLPDFTPSPKSTHGPNIQFDTRNMINSNQDQAKSHQPSSNQCNLFQFVHCKVAFYVIHHHSTIINHSVNLRSLCNPFSKDVVPVRLCRTQALGVWLHTCNGTPVLATGNPCQTRPWPHQPSSETVELVQTQFRYCYLAQKKVLKGKGSSMERLVKSSLSQQSLG